MSLKATRKKIRNSVSNRMVMWGCNIRVCFCKFEPRLQRMMIQVSHWCFHHLHPKAEPQNLPNVSVLVFSKLISPLFFFLAQTGLVNTPLGGQSSPGMMKNTLYIIVFLGHKGAGFWTNVSSLPEQCVVTALHSSLSYVKIQQKHFHFPPCTWSGNPQGQRRANTWSHGWMKPRAEQ